MEEEVSESFTLPERYWTSFQRKVVKVESWSYQGCICQAAGIQWLLVTYPKWDSFCHTENVPSCQITPIDIHIHILWTDVSVLKVGALGTLQKCFCEFIFFSNTSSLFFSCCFLVHLSLWITVPFAAFCDSSP